MKGLILLVIGIIIVLILVVVGVAAFGFINHFSDAIDNVDEVDFSVDKAVDKVKKITNSKSSSSDDSESDDIVNEEVIFNAQEGEGYYREVTYKDGGFRQYDVDSGELIGSSYSGDQAKLPSLE